MSSFKELNPGKGDVPVTPTLKVGGPLTKLGRRGAPHKRSFTLSDDGNYLVWKSTSIGGMLKGKAMTRVDFTSIKRVTKGQSTIPFVRQKSNTKITDKTNLSFSIIYENAKGDETSLDICCDNQEEFDNWYTEVTALYKFHKLSKDSNDQVLRFAKRQWSVADANNDGTLSLKEITNLIQKLNIDLTSSYIAKTFAEIDADNSGNLDYMEFQVLLDLLNKRDDIEHLWAALVDDSIFNKNISVASYMSKKVSSSVMEASIDDRKFHRFLSSVQGMDVTLEQTKLKIAALKGEDEEFDGLLRYAQFKTFLTSVDNSAFGVECSAHVYQDMNQPISHYWCASSHNTYCETDQLRGYSSVNRYINDLTKGGRCVELDCWDGPKGDPIIFHGHTLTGQIRFEDVIKAIKDYGFMASEYPVILSFENHCSIPQQQKMASYCKKILGSLLYVPELRADGSLPSPEECKGRVLIKAKRLPTSGAPEDEDEEEDEDKAEQEAAASAKESEALLGDSDAKEADGPKKKKEKKPKIAKELSDITFLGGCKFKSWEKSATEAAANDMSSFSEPKTEKLIKAYAKEWAEYNKRQMSRIYPAGIRIDSSNYDPVPSWCVGSQIVALNYQTSCKEMHLNDGKYMDNGNAGYILKPECLRIPGNNFDPMTGPYPPEENLNFTIEVMSASQLPKPKGASKGEVIDPYVVIELEGVPCDKKYAQTKVVNNNGFNPVFNETFTFKAKMKSLGLLYIVVMDSDLDLDGDDFIAYATIPLATLRQGIRNVNLLSMNGTNGGEFQFANLMVNVQFQ